MDEQRADGQAGSPAPDGAITPTGGSPSRRGLLLAGGIAVAAAAGGGIALGVSADKPDSGTPILARVPAELAAAAQAERALIAAADAALTAAVGYQHTQLRLIRADHGAHLAALEAATAAAVYPAVASHSSAAPASVPTRTVSLASVRTAEQRAAVVAAARALRMSGRDAALLASIAASEAAHAELLT